MEEREFVERRRGTRGSGWRVRAPTRRRAGIARTGAASLRQMHEDYRRAAADLAYAQTHFAGSPTHDYLNRLVGAGARRAVRRGAAAARRRMWRFLVARLPATAPRSVAADRAVGRPAPGRGAARLRRSLYVDYPLARMFLPEQFRDGVTDDFQQTQQQAERVVGRRRPAAVGVHRREQRPGGASSRSRAG